MPTDTSAVGKNADVPDKPRAFRISDELYDAAGDLVWERRVKAGITHPVRLGLRAWVADPDAFEAACRAILGEDS